MFKHKICVGFLASVCEVIGLPVKTSPSK